jgi:hypothetical protein
MTAYASKPVSRLGRFAEIARVLVRLDDVASVIVNANHSIMKSALSLFIEPRLKLRSP